MSNADAWKGATGSKCRPARLGAARVNPCAAPLCLRSPLLTAGRAGTWPTQHSLFAPSGPPAASQPASQPSGGRRLRPCITSERSRSRCSQTSHHRRRCRRLLQCCRCRLYPAECRRRRPGRCSVPSCAWPSLAATEPRTMSASELLLGVSGCCLLPLSGRPSPLPAARSNCWRLQAWPAKPQTALPCTLPPSPGTSSGGRGRGLRRRKA